MTLGDDARRILDSAREAYAPRPSERARIKRALALQIAAGASAAASAAAGSSLSALVASKAVVVGLVASAALGTTVAVDTWRAHVKVEASKSNVAAPPPKARVASHPRVAPAPSTAASATLALAPAASASATLVLPPSASATLAVPPLTSGTLARRPSAGAQPTRAAPAPVNAMPPHSVEAEAQLLGDAQRALANGDASRALRVIEEHARAFPHGALGEERQAARVMALCALGRTAEAQREAHAFLTRTPNSPLAMRVQAACAQKDTSP